MNAILSNHLTLLLKYDEQLLIFDYKIQMNYENK